MLQLMIYAQRPHNLSISLNNNGQLNDVLDEFYFNPSSGYGPNDDVFTYKKSEFKLGLDYDYVFNSNLILGLTLHYGKRLDQFEVGNQAPTYYPVGDKFLQYFGTAGLAGYTINLEKLQLSSGLEIVYYSIGEYTDNYFQENETSKLHQRINQSGGHTFGINSITQLKFYFGERFFLTTKLRFGLMKYDLGETYIVSIIEQNPVTYPEILYSQKSTYDKIALTEPELSFGIGFSFGKRRD